MLVNVIQPFNRRGVPQFPGSIINVPEELFPNMAEIRQQQGKGKGPKPRHKSKIERYGVCVQYRPLTPKGTTTMNDTNHPGGRPTSYRPEFCDRVIELGKQGYGKAEIAAELDVERKTLDNWCNEYPEFLHAMSRARELSLAWWDSEGRKGICNRDFNSNAYRLQVCNRFPDDWRDQQRLELSGSVKAENDVTSLKTALALHHILQRLEARRAAAEDGEIIETTAPPMPRIESKQ
jgi:hypothetical protein